ncbi:MAG: hypothetical protein KC501_18435 [Myxococcales bacterium]|nr:hypothetical protein [Myxococcales bacterium]
MQRGRRLSPILLVAGATVVVAVPVRARADEPVLLRQTWSGHVGFFATGAPMAVDGPDADTTSVDTLAQPAMVEVGPPDIPASAELLAAYLYWGGSIPNSECTNPAEIDDAVDFTPPGGMVMPVLADACFCSVAGSMAYDVQLCRAEVTALVPMLEGTYVVDSFAALIDNQTTNNASFSIVVVYSAPLLSPRRVALYDGLLTMSSDTNQEQTITLGGLDIDDPPSGDLTWYVLEGDVGGSVGEGVEVTGSPGGGVLVLSDAVNPAGNPMNHTINTTIPVQVDTLGVDIDRFSIDAALLSTDDAVEVRYTAGIDKWWLAYDVVGVNVFEPVLYAGSEKRWELHDDADGDGAPSPGDVVRYTVHLENTGNAEGLVGLVDSIPPEAESWALVDAGGGTDVSMGNTLEIVGVPIAVGGSADVVLDVVLAMVPAGTEMSNVASYSAEPGGLVGELVAPPVVIGEAAVGDSSGGGESTGGSVDGSGTGEGATGGMGTGGDSGVVEGTSVGPSSETGDVVSADGTSVGSTGGAGEASGCGCRAESSPGRASGWWWGWLVLPWARRRRGRQRRGGPRCGPSRG